MCSQLLLQFSLDLFETMSDGRNDMHVGFERDRVYFDRVMVFQT